ncbi:MAG: DUF7309 domain-containing protein, partial [Anaerolineae bacterium]
VMGVATLIKVVSNATPEEWRTLYRACEQFRNLAPWDWMDDSQVIGVRDPDSREIGWCVVMGNARQVFGLWVYRGARGYAAYSLMSFEIEPEFNYIAKLDYLSLSFENRKELDRTDLELIRQSGLKPRGQHAWPLLRSKTPWHVPWRLNADEVRYMVLVLGQVSEKAIQLKKDPRTPLIKGGKLLVREPELLDGEMRWRDEWVEPGLPEPERVAVTLNVREIDSIRKRARVTDETWEVDVFPLQAIIRDKGVPYYPMTLLVVNRGLPPIVHFMMVEPEPGSWQPLAESFVDGVGRAGRIPRQIRVARPEVAAMLSPICFALGVKMKQVERLTALERVRDDLEKWTGR